MNVCIEGTLQTGTYQIPDGNKYANGAWYVCFLIGSSRKLINKNRYLQQYQMNDDF